MAGEKKTPSKKVEKAQAVKTEKPKRKVRAPKFLRSFGGYFAGSWQELRQTKWPNRKATWSLTVAVILFTAALFLFVLGLDYAFNLFFKEVIL